MTSAPNFHESFQVKEQPPIPSDRRFGMTLSAVLIVLGCIKAFFLNFAIGAILIAGGAAFLALTYARPRAVSSVKAFFLKIAPVIARVINPVLMGILFAVCFVPGAFIMRALRHDPLEREFDSYATTYWKERAKNDLPDPMKYQF